MTTTKIGFILSSNSADPLPSTRISVLNMFPYLVAAGYEPLVAFEPAASTEVPDISGLAARLRQQGVDIAYFQKVRGPSAVAEAVACHSMGIRTVFGVCDLIENEMAEATDATIAISTFLRRQYAPELQAKVHVVHDGIENPEFRKHAGVPGKAKLRNQRICAALVTSSQLFEIPILGKPPGFLEVSVIGNYPPRPEFARHWKEVYWKASTLPKWRERLALVRHQFLPRFRTINWNPDTVYQQTAACDIAIIPVDTRDDPVGNAKVSMWQVKSENRLTLAMALGMAVVASPVPSYLEVVEQGVNGYLATTRTEWLECLELLQNPENRRRIGDNARASVIDRYSKEEQARKLIAVLDGLRTGSRATVAA